MHSLLKIKWAVLISIFLKSLAGRGLKLYIGGITNVHCNLKFYHILSKLLSDLHANKLHLGGIHKKMSRYTGS